MMTISDYCSIAALTILTLLAVANMVGAVRAWGIKPDPGNSTDHAVLEVTPSEVRGIVRRLYDGAERSAKKSEVVTVDIYDHTRGVNSAIRFVIRPPTALDNVTPQVIDAVAGADWTPARG
jgi:hypothetical protein